MRLFTLIMLILGALSFLVEVIISRRPQGRPTPMNFVALGLLFWILVPLVHVADTFNN